jgi:hypothetical protein
MRRVIIMIPTAATLLLSPVALAAGEPNTLTPAERAAGWTLLFDGVDTGHWRGYQRPGFPESGWIVEDGALRVVAGGGGGDLITKAQYESFELRLEWKAAPRANSGIMYRVVEGNPAPWHSGPEMQILDDGGHGLAPDDPHSAGALYDLYRPATGKTTHPAGAWNEVRIVLRDGVLRQEQNGTVVAEADLSSDDWARRVAESKFNAYPGFGTAEVGHICLQDHGNDVWFRNIRIRDLDAPMPHEIDLLAGSRLDQWTFHLRDGGTMDDVWSFADDVLICAGRPIGYIRTDADYTSYVLKLQWRFDPEKGAGNSGVLLRMIGEDTVWPRSVEAQLQSGNAGDFWNIGEFVMKAAPERTNGRNTKRLGGRERPLGEWNDYEIIVDRDRVVLVVNDEVVNEAWDVAEVPGKICLQSEGAEIHFRHVRLSEIRRPAGR